MKTFSPLLSFLATARMLAVALALVAGFALAGLIASPASAHVVLQGAEHPVDAVVPAAPTTIAVQMSGEILESGSTVTVTGPGGAPVDMGDGHLDLNDLNRRTLIATLQTGLPDGIYTVDYSAYPSDGHEPTVGSYTFTVGTAGAAATPVLAGATPVGTPAATPIATPVVLGDTPAASTNSDGLGTTNLSLLILAALVVLLGGGLAVVRASRRH